MEEELFEKKIPKEEQIYRSAVKLQNAVSCVLYFERKAAALRSAAKKFEKLGEYKDSAKRMKQCTEAAEQAEEEGSRSTMEEAKLRQERARTKSDYIDAITEFRRVRKMEAYSEEAKAHIQACKKEIVRLENRAVWKKRITVLAVIAACVVVFMLTPLYPFARGYTHQLMGEYETAIADYKEASVLSWSKELTGACYYKLGQQKADAGREEEALALFGQAKKYGNREAKKQYRILEQKMRNGD